MLTLVKERSNANPNPKEVINPVADLWDIELIYGKHSDFSELTYGVRYTTRLEGNASKCYLVVELREKFEEVLKELNVFGAIEKAELHKSIDYIKYLKIKGVFTRVPNLSAAMEGAASADESLELFGMIEEAILNNTEAFPTISSDEYKHNDSLGVILDSEQYTIKYGANAVGITTEGLLEILGLEGNTKNVRLTEIARGWKEQGLLLHKTRQSRLQEPIKPQMSSKEVKRFYIFRVEGLER